MGLESLQKTSVPDQVYNMLKQEIMVGEYPVGSKIPSETELCKILNVSRVSVRSAVQKLSILGLIETRVGDGNYVREFDFKEYIDNIGELIITDDDMRSMAEFRTVTELACAKMVMERATKEQFAVLLDLAEQVDQSFAEKNLKKNIALDLQFHYKIHKYSNNKIFKLSYQAFGSRMYQGSGYHLNKKHSMEEGLLNGQSHTRLVQSIMDKDIQLCEQLYKEHFVVYRKE